MVKTTVIHTQKPQLNASLMVILIIPIILHDYELQEDGLYCYLIRPISDLQIIIKTLLAALYEITGTQFYFEIIKDQEAVLKIYGEESLEFSQDLLFRSIIPSQGRGKL